MRVSVAVRDFRGGLAASAAAFAAVFSNPDLRRIELAWGASTIGASSYIVALAIFAYEAGGAAAVGLVALIRFVPSALTAPFVAVLADRYPRRRVMVGSDVARALILTAAAAAVFAEAPAVVYVLAGFSAVASTAFRPAQAALLPGLASTPEELAAANVASSTVESAGVFVGAALGGLLVAASNPGVVFVVTAAIVLWSALLVSRIRAEAAGEHGSAARDGAWSRELFDGFRTLRAERDVRLLVGLFAAQTLVDGVLSVLIVVSALTLLDMGEPGVGFLSSAVGLGGLLGALVGFALVGRRQLASSFGFGILLWGVPIALLAVWPHPVAALVLLTIVGVGNTVVDTTGFTLLQRIVSDDVMGRVFGVLYGAVIATVAAGALIAPVLVDVLGIRGALLATGLFLPVVAALAWHRLRAIDARAIPPEHELALLGGVPFFAPLRPATIEHLASRLFRVPLAKGSQLFREGDPGDRFYLIDKGELDVEVDGTLVATLAPGGYVGEIALLRGALRMATVTARTDVELLALERDDFVPAVTGHAASAQAANAVVATRLGRSP